MKGIKFILCGIAVILVGIAFYCGGINSIPICALLLFATGLSLAFYGLKKE